MKLVILLSFMITATVATNTKTDLEDEKSETKVTGGYHHYDLAILLILLAFKFKVILLVLAAFFGFGSYTKLLSGIGGYYKGLNKCPPQVVYDGHKHNHDYTHPDRLDRGLEYSMYYEDMDLELLSNVMKGVGLTNLNFNITESGSCKRRLVCEADRMAHTRPILGYTMQLLSRNLSQYRTPRSTNERTSVTMCAALYPECRDIANVYRHENKYGLKTKPRRPPQDRFLANGT